MAKYSKAARARESRPWGPVRTRDGQTIERPVRPYPGFPLTPHASGSWCKTIRGKLRYFGRWANREDGKLVPIPGGGWEAALEKYEEQQADLHAGRKPRPKVEGGLRLDTLCNDFLTEKNRKLQAGEMTPRTFADYCNTTDLIIDQFGKDRVVYDLGPDDFGELRARMAKRWGPVRLGNEINRVRSVFKYAYENRLIDHPVRYGTKFNKPSRTTVRKANNKKRLPTAAELRRLTKKAETPLRAMILLGVNCGFGNHDIADLPLDALDLDGGWIDFPRPKTGIERRCPLWRETVQALREAIDARRTPTQEDAEHLVFVSPRGGRYIRQTKQEDPTKWGTRTDLVRHAFEKLQKDLDLKWRGFSFYTLRHVFETIAGGSKDQVAVDAIMGHVDASMAANYRQGIDDERLRAVADHVHGWLYGGAK